MRQKMSSAPTMRLALTRWFSSCASILLISSLYSSVSVNAQVPSAPIKNAPEALPSQVLGEPFTKVELYFGLSKPDGTTVSVMEWQRFVDREITPRFREGFLVLMGYGQYQTQSGQLVRENSRLVVLLYQTTPEKEKAIDAIVQTYKRTFQQESVLRTTSLVKATF